MSEENERKDAPASGRKPLTLTRTTAGGTVKQSFSHGRSKSVVVEMKQRRTIGPGGAPGAAPVAPGPGVPPPRAAASKPAPTPAAPAPAPKPSATLRAGLSDDEARRRADAVSRAQTDDQVRRERLRVEEEQRRALEEAQRRLLEEDEAAVTEARRREAEQSPAEQVNAAPAEARAPIEAAPIEPGPDILSELGGRVKQTRRPMPVAPVKPAKKGEAERRKGKLTLEMVERITEGDDDRVRSLAAMRRAREKEKERAKIRGASGADARVAREVTIPEAITIQELSNRMAMRASEIIKYLMRQGTMATINDVLDPDTAELIATEFGHTVRRVAESDVEEGLQGIVDEDKDLQPRPPVVTIMGHVDHGKTSLLDALRQTDVAAGEAGGITQHIGAYQVKLKNGQRVTFLDTPGHAAFSSMRSRGAQVTDIVVLVVAADDGVMPQTIEAITHTKAAGVPMIVAINKMDKEDANPDRVLNELLQHEVLHEGVGGEVQVVKVSATKKTGLDELVERILLQAEVLDLRANPDRPAEATIIESKLERGRGAVATALVKSGTLKRGDIIVAGGVWGRVRALVNERDQQVPSAGPSEPVEVMGLEGVPDPGDILHVVENETRAREVAEYRQRARKDKSHAGAGPRSTSLEAMMAKFKDAANTARELPVVIKADVQGSAEAIQFALEKLNTDEVRARVMNAGVGGISESDVTLAKASGAPLIGFNVRASKEARELAEREGVEIRYYNIIYDLIDDVKGVMSGMLAPLRRETFLGNAEILEVFNISKVGRIAGCRVTEGKMIRGAGIRLLRDNVVIHEGGKLQTLKRFKDDVNEVQSGQECGMSFENYQDLKAGDLIECFNVEVVQRSL
ncbi:MAG TPA: translation initiation factor IF-2 [Caulobacterales bacterium]|nr:translation initiation factor IF-2 [Caulobacterales bacterium]